MSNIGCKVVTDFVRPDPKLVEAFRGMPVANIDAYFGTTSFGRKYLKQIPETILERSETGFGLCRYRLGGTLVIK